MRLGLLPLAALVLAGCARATPEAPTTETYREPTGLFTLDHPAGWSLRTTERTGVRHWRWTPDALAEDVTESPRELALALIPLPEDVELTLASLEEVAEYVRDATIETAAESGDIYQSSPVRTEEVDGRPAARFDLVGRDGVGAPQRLSLVVVRSDDAAFVLAYGCPEAEAKTLFPLLERCAATLRPGAP